MIGKLNHVGVATPSIEDSVRLYRDVLRATSITEKRALEEQGVWVCFVNLPNSQIELIEPLGENSPLKGFLAKNPAGGQHHVCFEVEDIIAGEFTPGFSYGGLAEGWIDFAPYGPAVTDEILDLVEERKQQIIDGTFDMFAGPIFDNQGNEVIAEGETIPFAERSLCCEWLVDGIVGEIPAS